MIILVILEFSTFFSGMIAAVLFQRWDIAAVLVMLAVYFNQKGGELQ